jgi:hypothetical protein
MFKNSIFNISIYIVALISLILIEFFEDYFSKNILFVIKIIGTLTFLFIILESIITRFFKKD